MKSIRCLPWLLATAGLLLSLETAAARPATDLTGTWTGTLPVDGVDRAAVIQLHQRADGSVMGYVLGGTPAWTVSQASSSGGRLRLEIDRAEPGRTVAIAVDARLRGGRLRGTASEGGAPRPIAWTRGTADVCERRFLMAPGGGDSGFADVAVATDCAGRFLAGAFTARDACGPLGCGGAVTSFAETGRNLSIGLATGGTCPGTAALNATFDPAARAYGGSFTARDCQGTSSGAIFGARWTRTRASHVQGIFAALGRLADDLEAGAAFAEPYPPVSAAYLHFGRKEPDLLADLRAEVSRYSAIQVTFDRFRGFSTVPDAGTFPMLVKPAGADFHDLRQGTPRSGGPALVYRDAATDLAHSELRPVRQEGGAWRIFGNQSAPFDLPFRYEVGSGFLAVPAPAGGGLVYASVGPWGAHFTPLTGHAYGNLKSDLAGFFSKDSSSLREIAGDGVGNDDGVCAAGEACAFPTTAAAIAGGTPVYTAPLPGEVIAVEYAGPAPDYFDGAQRWAVRLRLSLGAEIRFDHLARIAPALRDLVLARTGIDTDLYAGAQGDILGGGALPVAAGTELARPQVFAREAAGNPGLFRGGGTFGDRPWAQMEFFLAEDGEERCVFDLLPAARQAALQAVLDAEMRDPASQRYAAYQALRWTWAAEGRLCPAAPPGDGGPFAQLFAHSGGWFERPAPGTTPDELFAIVAIDRSAASYDPALYASPAVDSLVLRRRAAGAPFTWALPGGGSASPFQPDGEVLAHTPSSLLIRWRDVGPAPLYQRAAYSLAGGGLKIQWGPLAATAGGATLPPLDPAAPCGDAAVICYGPQHLPGF